MRALEGAVTKELRRVRHGSHTESVLRRSPVTELVVITRMCASRVANHEFAPNVVEGVPSATTSERVTVWPDRLVNLH